jgi:hypothetical protein
MNLRVCGTSTADADLVQVEAAGVSGWCAWPDAPGVGTTVVVELDVPAEIAWDDIEVGGDGRPCGPEPITGLVVHGEVLDVDELDVLTLRLPRGAILLVDTSGEPPLHVVGRAVTLHLDGVVVYPTNA